MTATDASHRGHKSPPTRRSHLRAWQIKLITALVLLGLATLAIARPRPPLPPFPDFGLLNAWRFDDTISWGNPDNAPIAAQGVELVDSWSGYALRISGDKTAFVRFPALNGDGRPNIRCDSGSIRFWFSPNWSSLDAGGKGPGTYARLIDVGAASQQATAWWSLYFDPAGRSVYFSAQADGRSADYLNAPISWQAGEWHQVTLAYGPKFSVLYLDGNLVAEGEGVSVWPDDKALATSGFCVGSDSSGATLADGQFDEFATFNYPHGPWEVGWNFSLLAPWSKLGPITPEEEAAMREAAVKRRADLESESGGQQYRMLLQNLSNCPTDTNVFLANITSAITTNQEVIVTFDLMGGTNGLLYDIFTTTNLCCTNIANTAWTWLERGPSCATYQYTNQPPWFGFYVVGTPVDSDGDGLTDAYERLVSNTDPYTPDNPDTDGDGISNFLEWLLGGNPSVAASADTNGLIRLQVYSAFR